MMNHIKITFVGLFWSGRLCAQIIVKFGRKKAVTNILLTAKVENFRGSFGEFRPSKPQKLRNSLENARKNYFRPMSTNNLVKNYETYNINITLWSTSVF